MKGLRLDTRRFAAEVRFTHYTALFGTPWLYCGAPWFFWLTWHNYRFAIGRFGCAWLRIFGCTFAFYWETRKWL